MWVHFSVPETRVRKFSFNTHCFPSELRIVENRRRPYVHQSVQNNRKVEKWQKHYDKHMWNDNFVQRKHIDLARRSGKRSRPVSKNMVGGKSATYSQEAKLAQKRESRSQNLAQEGNLEAKVQSKIN